MRPHRSGGHEGDTMGITEREQFAIASHDPRETGSNCELMG